MYAVGNVHRGIVAENRLIGNSREKTMTDYQALKAAVMSGKRDEVTRIVSAAIEVGEDINPLLDQGMIPAMREIGDKFSRNEVYVPELLIAARAMQSGLGLIEPLLAASGREPLGCVAIGTVKGDLHDIGKNLVAIMLKGAGYQVVDLGVNCDIAKFESALANEDGPKPQVIACSALLTTTMPYMQELVQAFEPKGVKVIIGGAPLTQAYCDEIGASGYSEDANGAVKLVDRLLGKG